MFVFLFNKNTEWRGSQATKDLEYKTCVGVLHKIFPTQELMLSEDITVMMAVGLSVKHFESLFVHRLNRFYSNVIQQPWAQLVAC